MSSYYQSVDRRATALAVYRRASSVGLRSAVIWSCITHHPQNRHPQPAAYPDGEAGAPHPKPLEQFFQSCRNLSSDDCSKRSPFKPVHCVILSSHRGLGPWSSLMSTTRSGALYYVFLRTTLPLFSKCVKSKKAFFSRFLLTDVILCMYVDGQYIRWQ